MNDLKPWMHGPLELIRHGEAHLKNNTDFDRRMALVSLDNAIETAINTFLNLHPLQRGGIQYKKEDVENWKRNYYTKLEFLALFLKERGETPLFDNDAILFYHQIRNDMYHAGNGVNPDTQRVHEVRNAACWVFSTLFSVDAEALLSHNISVEMPVSDGSTSLSAFLDSLLRLRKVLLPNMDVTNLPHPVKDHLQDLDTAWEMVGFQIQGDDGLCDQFNALTPDLVRCNDVHRIITLGGTPHFRDGEVAHLCQRMEEMRAFVWTHAPALDLLPYLRARYSAWKRTDIWAVHASQETRLGRFCVDVIHHIDRDVWDYVDAFAGLPYLPLDENDPWPIIDIHKSEAENAERVIAICEKFGISDPSAFVEI